MLIAKRERKRCIHNTHTHVHMYAAQSADLHRDRVCLCLSCIHVHTAVKPVNVPISAVIQMTCLS